MVVHIQFVCSLFSLLLSHLIKLIHPHLLKCRQKSAMPLFQRKKQTKKRERVATKEKELQKERECFKMQTKSFFAVNKRLIKYCVHTVHTRWTHRFVFMLTNNNNNHSIECSIPVMNRSVRNKRERANESKKGWKIMSNKNLFKLKLWNEHDHQHKCARTHNTTQISLNVFTT